MCTFVGTFSGIDVVSFLIEDVVDSINQEVEGEGHPNQNRNDGWGEEIACQPHAHDCRADGVDPEHGPGYLDKSFQHPTSLGASYPQQRYLGLVD